jgi:hypothetical protein
VSTVFNAITMVAALVIPTMVVATPAGALSVGSASFNTGFARNGTALVLTVNTSNDVDCVRITGDHSAQTNGSGTVWTFNFTAGAGNGTKTVTATAFKNAGCTGNTASATASYVLDNTNPTISGTRTPAANANGWNNTDVGVNFTCSDGGSGIQSCTGSTTLTTEGANQSVGGTATDKAGNTASSTVTSISIDKTLPTLSGAPTTAPNGAGWYQGDVAIHWTCGDALSGIIAGTCPANSTISGEGTGLTASAAVSDRAANTRTSTSSPPVNIDHTAPVTTVSALPPWSNTDVTVTLTASDALSGVASTIWSLDGGATQTGTSVPVTTEGDHTLTFSSVDVAGNAEATQTVHVRIDKTSPTIGHTQSPSANVNGWNNTTVTVTFTCSDALSGVATCTTPQTITTEGHNQPVTGTALDNAGNTATDPATVSIDKTKPTISAARDRAPNANNWYDGDVIVTYTCSDALSGVATCSAPQTFGEGAGQSATGSVTDAADNSESVTDAPINVDKTAPTITGAPTTSPNADGWYSGDVTIHWTCSDALSGIAGSCPADSVITGSGAALTASASVSDKAGNSTLATSAQVQIDRLAPVTTSDAPATWQNTDVTVNLSAVDDLSGVKSTFITVNGGAPQAGSSITISAEGTTVLQFWSVDFADNAELAHSVSIMIDKTKPTILGSRTPAANANGWNNSDVGVNFSCSDELNGSGIASCTGSATLTGEGANQSASGTATDVAGNSESATVSGISIDKTAPALAGAPTTSPNGNGWYNGDVTIDWTCSDALSGIDGVCPPDDTISSEGTGLTAANAVSDRAGNTTNATSSPAVNVDRTAPVTTATAPPAWNNTDVTVNLSASDALSGVAATHWSLDGGADQTGNSVPVTTEGDHTLAFHSVDNAGNTETTQTIHVQIDKTGPTIGHTQSPLANVNDWNNTDVIVTFTCSDALSGIASCTAPQTIATEGHNQPVTGTALDNAGNTATDPATVSIDKTKPTISAARDRAPNANDWYDGDVTVTFTCGDTLSGVDSCAPPQTLGEGANQTATGSATDAAGNSDSASETGINVDETAPTITGAPTTSPNGNGWYNGDVTIHWTCSDALSGIDVCPPDSVVTDSGTGLTVSAAVSDLAGNTTVGTSDPVNIDRVAPETTSDAPTGWQTADVTVHFDATDDLSGVEHTFFSVNHAPAQAGSSVAVTAEGMTLIEFWSVDAAGNVETLQSATVLLDKSAPTISHTQVPAPNAQGWNNTSVDVDFSCADTVSGMASCSPGTTLSSDGLHQLVTGTAVDTAGNSASDTADVSIDQVKPTISGAPDRAPNANNWYDADVTVGFDCADALSGVALCSAPTTLGEGANQSVTGDVTDNADNAASATVADLNIDKTDPEISGAPTTSPNGAGWYRHDVTVEWTCADALSGIEGACPSDSTIAGEGENLAASASTADKAGNTAGAAVTGIKIDQTAPTTSASSPSEWVNHAVTVDLTASDNLSGVAETHSILDGGSDEIGTSVSITTEGTHSLEYWSVDAAGNEETHHTATVLIDLTAPTISHTQAPLPNGAGWNNTDVVVTFTCDDQPALSGLASCTTPQTVTTEGASQDVIGTAVDNAGNSATDTASVSVDKTKPTISGAPDRAPNANDWYNADVTVNFECTDALSGIATCAAPVTLGEGGAQSVTGTAVDTAGNSDDDTVAGINVDETDPTIHGAATTEPNANGWYNGDVTIHWTCSDALSGLDGACPADSVITTEGDDLSATASISDKAGNYASATVDGIKIDRVAPTTTSDAPSDWQNADVTVALTPHDGLSGVESTFSVVDDGPAQAGTTVAVTGEGVHSLEFWSVDAAGNAEVHQSVTIRIDKTTPTIGHTQSPPPNANSWNNTPVEVSFQCADARSGVASCSDPTTLSSDGAAQTVTGSAFDNAGNFASDSATVNIDQAKPTISAARDRAPNGNDWYDANVTVSFTCADALSGIESCEDPHTLGEGAAQSATGTAVDLAGNSDNVTESGINVDKTAPVINGAPTATPNANGWYAGDVTIHWTCSDALSGIDGVCPVDSVITSEGDNLSATASVSDLAGNSSSATVSGIKIDRTAPSTSASAPSAWVNNDVTVSLSATDVLSGVAATYSSLDGAPAEAGTSVSIASEGVHTLEYWSVDNADNEEAHSTVTIRIDKSAPTITHTQAPVPNANGWNNTAVTVTFDCADQSTLSGVASCTAPQTVSTEGQGQAVTGVALDNAGNSASDTATLAIDTTPPSISGAADRAPNGAGWYRDDVTVTYTCGDSLSGVVSCTDPVTLGQGANQSVTGSAVDAADNSAGTTVGPINIDKTDPTITGAPTTAPNGNGWYAGDVTIHWTCSDALSGIDGVCPVDSVITSEGDNLSASASVFDVAGNSSTATVSGIKIDRTAAVTSSDAPVGWRNADFTVNFSASDNLAGVATTYSRLDGSPAVAGSAVSISTQGTHTIEFWSVDGAGNAETHHTAIVQLDKTKPTITGAPTTAPNGAGWYRTPVTVHFTCADQAGLSGIASCTSDQTVATSGANQSVTGTALDNAGNSKSFTVSGLKVDLVAPTIAVSGLADGATYEVGAEPAPSCAAVDSLSGPNGCSGVVAGGSANGVGPYTYTATGQDVAGNATTRVVSYRVVYDFSGFLQPINDTAHQVGVATSIFKANSTVPVKFELRRANGTTVSPNSAPQWLKPVRGSSLAAAVDESAYSAPATSGDVYRVAGSQYIYNWSTNGIQAGYYYRIGVRLDDGTTYTVNIGLR